MNSEELLRHLRVDILRDTGTNRLWSDEVLYLYLNEAQREFCRETHILVEDMAIAFTTGESEYPLGPHVLFVASARVNGAVGDMISTVRSFVPVHVDATGIPQMFTTDEVTQTMRVFPIPDRNGVITIREAVFPSCEIRDMTVPGIPFQYHTALALFAAHRALITNDVDGGNTASSDRYLREWNQRVADAKRDVYRYRSGVSPSYIRNTNWTGKRRI